MQGPMLSVVVPVYRSSDALKLLVDGIRRVAADRDWSVEIVLVDDATPDPATRAALQRYDTQPDVRVIRLRRNRGQHPATITGLSFATGRICVVMDDDLQHDPCAIPMLVEPLLEQPELDAVIAAFPASRHPGIRRLGSRLVGSTIRWSHGLPAGFVFTSFLAMRSDVRRLVVTAGAHALEPVVGLLLVTVTDRIMNVDVSHHQRHAGRSGWSPGRLISLGLQLFRSVLFTPKGTRALAGIAFSAGAIAVLLSGGYLVRYWIGGRPLTGFTTLVLLLLGSLALSSFLLSGLLEGFAGLRGASWRDARTDVRSDSWAGRGDEGSLQD